MLPDADLFDVTNFFRSLMDDQHVAFVNPHSEISEDMEFAIRIGTNRGGNYHLFNTIEQAEDWLLETLKIIASAKNLA